MQEGGRSGSIAGRLLRWPPLHFAAVGAALFLAAGLLRPCAAPDAPTDDVIRVSEGQLRVLRARYEQRTGERADAEALRALVDGFVEQEMLYREALQRGLASDDPSATAQSMRMLLAREGERSPEPGELEAYFREHADAFAKPPRVTWSHVFFQRSRGARAPDAAAAAMQRIQREGLDAAAASALGDELALQVGFRDATRRQVALRFGEAFADALLALPEGQWAGPLESNYGLHLVRVEERREAAAARFEEVQEQVLVAWRKQRGEERLARALAELRGRYPVLREDAAGAGDRSS